MSGFVQNIKDCLVIAESMVYGNIDIVYYAHIPTIIVVLLIGIFVLVKGKDASSKALFFLNFVFVLVLTANLITWVSSSSIYIMFFWSLLGMLDALFFIAILFFTYISIYKKVPPLWVSVLFGLLFLPIILTLFTDNNLSGFNFNECGAIEGVMPVYVLYFKAVISLFIIAMSIVGIKRNSKNNRKYSVLLTIGVILLLCTYFLADYLTNYYGRFDFEIYGFIGMIILSSFLAYLIVKFKAFNIKMVGAQALVWALVILIGSEFLFVNDITNQILVAVTLIISSILGLILVRSVKKEVALRENVEKLAGDLKKANTRLLELDKQKSEFVSFATHQLRAPLTAMKGYASLILEGDLGVLNDKVRDAITRISNSSKTLTNIVDDYLNISRIELGTMKYSFEVMDFKDIVTHVIAELKPNIDKSGLKFNFSTNPLNPQERFMIHADRDKFKQVIANLIDNSMKYTRSGSIEVLLSKNNANRKITFSIKDTGIGISPEVMPKLFVKFVRADNANKQNIYGTGLGLYVAKDIITSHKGKIWAESDGDGKGSTFLVEMDMEV